MAGLIVDVCSGSISPTAFAVYSVWYRSPPSGRPVQLQPGRPGPQQAAVQAQQHTAARHTCRTHEPYGAGLQRHVQRAGEGGWYRGLGFGSMCGVRAVGRALWQFMVLIRFLARYPQCYSVAVSQGTAHDPLRHPYTLPCHNVTPLCLPLLLLSSVLPVFRYARRGARPAAPPLRAPRAAEAGRGSYEGGGGAAGGHPRFYAGGGGSSEGARLLSYS